MIIQPYAFKGDDFNAVYAQARQFCARLHDAGLSVSLPDGFRSNTKTYPDYDRSVTVIEVFPDIAVAEQFELAEKIYADVMAKPDTNPALIVGAGDYDISGELLALFAAFYRLPGADQMDLHLQNDGRGAVRLGNEDIAYWVSPSDGIKALERLCAKPVLTVGLVSFSKGDDFDPFLVADEDLP